MTHTQRREGPDTRGVSRRALVGMAVWLLGLVASGAVLAAAPDTIEQRVMACTGCHGAHGEGSAASGYVPRIAGVPARYLREQLINFREGRRRFADMNFLVSSLSDSYIEEIANYFANLPASYGPVQPTSLSPQEAQRAEQLVRHGDSDHQVPACTRCHGDALTGAQPAVPGLLGLPRDYLRAQMGAWRNGQRHGLEPDCMATVVERLNPTDIALVSAWLSARVPSGLNSHPAAGLPEAPPLECGSLPGLGAGHKP